MPEVINYLVMVLEQKELMNEKDTSIAKETNLHTFGASDFEFGIGTNGSCSQWTAKLDRVLHREILGINCL